MIYVPFHEKFPEVAEKETRSITVFNDPDLPSDSYGLTEAYCDDPDCDCRRVFFNVISLNKEDIVAVVAFGWESNEFYAKWYGEDDPKVIEDLKGPILNSSSPQSKIAPAILEKVKFVVQDREYVDRLKKHYSLFKDKIVKEGKQVQNKNSNNSAKLLQFPQKIGRNDLCPCGSGKKFKKCCLK